MKNPIIIINNNKVEANNNLLKVLMPGIIRGEGVFETILIKDGSMCFFDEHYQRLCKGATLKKLQRPKAKAALKVLCSDLIKINKIHQGRMRIQYFTDAAEVFLIIIAQPLNQRVRGKKPLALMVSKHVYKKDKYSVCKQLQYEPYYEAHQEAQAQGFDEAVLLNSNKVIVEGSTTNIFFFFNKTLHTPALKWGCLNGIIRQAVIKLARKEGVSVKAGEYTIPQLKKADEVFVTNSLLGIRRVSMLDAKKWNNLPSHRLNRLIELYQNHIKN